MKLFWRPLYLGLDWKPSSWRRKTSTLRHATAFISPRLWVQIICCNQQATDWLTQIQSQIQLKILSLCLTLCHNIFCGDVNRAHFLTNQNFQWLCKETWAFSAKKVSEKQEVLSKFLWFHFLKWYKSLNIHWNVACNAISVFVAVFFILVLVKPEEPCIC